ncbi:hypothetical protein, partial [Streptomyces albidoflavus]|uniref:hypothetical protein n=1 Tax=Streptomyces albidoflavus TaxID=1886 RepID=UPI00211CA80F
MSPAFGEAVGDADDGPGHRREQRAGRLPGGGAGVPGDGREAQAAVRPVDVDAPAGPADLVPTLDPARLA